MDEIHHESMHPWISVAESRDTEDWVPQRTHVNEPLCGSNLGQHPVGPPLDASCILCYGSICDVCIRLLLQSHHMQFAERVQRLPVLYKQSRSSADAWYGLQYSDNFFAVFSKNHSQVFHEILQKYNVEFEAIVDTGQVRDKTKSWLTNRFATMVIDINVYGNRKDAHLVGTALSLSGFYLQEPLAGRQGVQYYNPHFLHVQELQGLSVDATPMFAINTNEAADEPETSTASEDFDPIEIGSSIEFNSILDSLSQSSMLQKRGGSGALVTALKDHQMQALDFVLRRETLTLPIGFSLWETHVTEKQEQSYRHKITGFERPQKYECKGGLLADEMGLGKTMVMLATIVGSLERATAFALQESSTSATHTRSKATLVVVPSSILIDSYLAELQQHVQCNTISVVKFHGPGRHERARECLDCDIVFTTYKTIVSEVQRVVSRGLVYSEQSNGSGLCWTKVSVSRRLLLEKPILSKTKSCKAHEVRNRKTKQFQAIAGLAAEHRWCLSGTPFQNSLEDISSLVNILRVPLLDHPATFRRFIMNQETRSVRDRYRTLRLLLTSICLRRTKQVAGLPEPVIEVQHLEFNSAERNDYEEILRRAKKLDDLNVSGLTDSCSPLIFQALLKLRLFCNHGHLRSCSDENDLEDALCYLQQNDAANCVFCSNTIYSINDHLDTDGGRLISQCKHLACRRCYSEASSETRSCPACRAGTMDNTVRNVLSHLKEATASRELSATQPDLHQTREYPSKLLAFVDDVKKHIAAKSIVFSYWKKTLDVVGTILQAQNLHFYFIHGSIPHTERSQILNRFRSSIGHSILLMTLGTGAVGLNLGVASRIYLLEPQWNPFLEQQAFGRAQRLGQTEKVTIIRFLMKDTIEDTNVQSRQLVKMHIASRGFGN